MLPCGISASLLSLLSSVNDMYSSSESDVGMVLVMVILSEAGIGVLMKVAYDEVLL